MIRVFGDNLEQATANAQADAGNDEIRPFPRE
jgi:hypothetical protein